MDNTKEFTCLSLCTGYGGIEFGLKRAIPTLRTIVYVERECFAAAGLVAKMEAGAMDQAPVWTDVKTFDGTPFRRKVGILVGGYPCQPFSHAGRRRGTDDPRHLWPYFETIIRTVEPLWCFFENVSGHLSLGFPEVYQSLRSLHYLVEAGLFRADEVGARHRRQRLFILAHAEHDGLYAPKNRGGDDEAGNGTQEGQEIPIKPEGAGEPSELCSLRVAWPDEPQHTWEEPQTLGDTGYVREGNCGRAGTVTAQGSQCDIKASEPELGRAVDGSAGGVDAVANRVERFRALGNGVVWQQAEYAFRYLYRKHMEK